MILLVFSPLFFFSLPAVVVLHRRDASHGDVSLRRCAPFCCCEFCGSRTEADRIALAIVLLATSRNCSESSTSTVAARLRLWPTGVFRRSSSSSSSILSLRVAEVLDPNVNSNSNDSNDRRTRMPIKGGRMSTARICSTTASRRRMSRRRTPSKLHMSRSTDTARTRPRRRSPRAVIMVRRLQQVTSSHRRCPIPGPASSCMLFVRLWGLRYVPDLSRCAF